MSFPEVLAGLFAGVIIFFCPGYAVLVILKSKDFQFPEMCCAAGGVSMMVIPLVLLFTTYVGVELTAGLILLILLPSTATCTWDLRLRISAWRNRESSELDLIYALLALVFVATITARVLMVRGIDYPLWTDSYHHTIITDLISDQGRLPSSYAPYAHTNGLTYHFGFHAASAWFHQLSGIPVPRSVVLTGQIINALAVLGSYLLGSWLFQDRVAGLVSAACVGLISHMPAFFVNWGRYTQLSGQVALPVLMVLTVDALNEPADRTRSLLIVSIGAAGLFLVHVRVFLFYGLFAALLLLFRSVTVGRRQDSKQIQRLLINCLAIGGLTLLILAPWLWRFFEGFGSTVAQELTGEFQLHRYGAYFRWRLADLVDYGLPIPLLCLAVAGGVLGIVRAEPNSWLLVIWFLGLLTVANVHIIGVVPPFSNLIVSMIAYLPGTALIGYLSGSLVTLSTRLIDEGRRRIKTVRTVALLGAALILMIGTKQTVDLIRPENGFVRQADLEAMVWIQHATPNDSLFYIGTHFWTPVVAHGVDGGYWIPWLANRETILPPQVYASDGSPEYIEFVNRRARELTEAETSHTLWETMKRHGVSHVYIGSRPSHPQADLFLADPTRFRSVYSAGDVWVFEVAR